jgi:predicted GNAT family acetyltransferase
MTNAHPLEFELADNGRRYRALLSGEEVAYGDVDPIGADGLLIRHTEVATRFEGRGYGSALVRHILEDAKRQGRGVVPACPFALAFIQRHPEYQALVRKQ